MNSIKFLSAAVIAGAIVAGCNNSPAITVTNDNGETTTVSLPDKALTDSVSYLIGINFGYFIKANDFGNDINYAPVKKGMMDFINSKGNMNSPEFNEQFKISPDKMNDLFNKFITERRNYVAEANKAEGKAFLDKNKQNDGVVVTESGLQYKIIEAGSDVKPGPADTVFVHYKGTLIDGTQFDASDPEKEPVQMIMNRVIKGWTEGLQLIGEGGKIELYIPADLAYGQRSMGEIKANSTLIFDIELAKVAKVPAAEEETAETK